MAGLIAKTSFNNCPNLADEDIYMNVTLFNNTNDRNIPTEYREERGQPFLQKASDYKMSIVRLDLPTDFERIFTFDSSKGYTVTYYDH
jgi:hypothetical protein